ncbi:MAG: PEP-CTERM sorting domain-containing protein [Phycisphaerae bacterium]|nr:PEP-CTERM sorting domain-containing protein [Phycisphaerae bacterium]
MKTKMAVGIVALFLVGIPVVSASEIREYLLGDVDGIVYNGAGSVDDVYADPDLMAWLQAVAPTEPNDNFDVINTNNNVPFTFTYPLAADETIIGATLTIGLRSTDFLASSDEIYLHNSNATLHWGYSYNDLGWLPIPDSGVTVRSINLANVLGDNHLPLLQDGQLDVHITDDSAVDYARLTVEVVPEPATVSLFCLGVFFIHHRKKKH